MSGRGRERRRIGGRRWALAVLLGCVTLLIVAPGAFATGTGQISGKVTKVVGGEAIEGIEVCAYEKEVPSTLSGELKTPFVEHCAQSDAGGGYVLSELSAGEYFVEFYVPYGSNLNYITQYYKDQSSFNATEPVGVVAGHLTEEVDAELQVGGEIRGEVIEATGSEDIVPLAGIEVTAYEAAGEEFPVGFAETAKNGEYTISGLPTGHYKVGFSPAFESGLDYITQYYDGKSSLASAESLEVVQEQVKNLDVAELQPGGAVEGVVSDATTHMPLAKAVVVALGAGETVEGLAFVEAGGHYAITGLTTGSYKIGFASGGYIVQYYNDQPSFASANPVVILQGSTASQIDASLVLKASVKPVVPGLPIRPTAGLAPIAPAVPPSLTPVVTLSSAKVNVSGGSAKVPIACANATCTGRIELTEQVVVKRRRGGKTTSRKEVLVLGRGSYSLAAGRSATILVRLTAKGKGALAKAVDDRMPIEVLASVNAGKTAKRTVVLNGLAPAKGKSKHR